ncbi:hypothetical protein PP427_gp090 [Salmonella phage KM16]|nr:hypothetical protein PP427_gp090 [Salmonella phage KM16]
MTMMNRFTFPHSLFGFFPSHIKH